MNLCNHNIDVSHWTCILCDRDVAKTETKKGTTMNTKEFLEYFEKITGGMLDTCKKKNADYTGVTEDPFANFTQVEKFGICKAEIGFLTRMTDKLCRISSFVKNNELQVKDESVHDTLLDLANYSIIMSAYIKSKKGKQ